MNYLSILSSHPFRLTSIPSDFKMSFPEYG